MFIMLNYSGLQVSLTLIIVVLYSLSFAQEGESLKTGILLIIHLKIHISAKMTVSVTTNSIQDGT